MSTVQEILERRNRRRSVSSLSSLPIPTRASPTALQRTQATTFEPRQGLAEPDAPPQAMTIQQLLAQASEAFRAAEAQRPEGTPDPFLLPESTRLRDRLPTEIVQDIQAQRPDTGPSAFARAGRKAATGVSRFLLDPGPGLRGAAGAIGGAAADVGGFLADPLRRDFVDSPLARSSGKALELAFAESPLASNLELIRKTSKVGGALLSAVQQQLLSDLTVGEAGARVPAFRIDPELSFDENIDAFTDQLGLLPGQQGLNEIIADPTILIPFGAGARGVTAAARNSVREAARQAKRELERVASERARGVGPLPIATQPGLESAVKFAIPEGAAVATPGPAASNIIGLKPIQAGLSLGERIENIIRRLTSKLSDTRPVERDKIASGAFRERDRVAFSIDSQGNRLGVVSRRRADIAFPDREGDRIPSLAGIDPSVPGAPTISDVAARLPRYQAALTNDQVRFFQVQGDDVAPFSDLFREVGIEVGVRDDIIEGGVYFPRGRAGLEGADDPLPGSGLGRGKKTSSELGAVFNSQAEGIEAGWKYAPFHETMEQFAKDSGRRAADQHVANALAPLGRTAAKRTDQVLRARVTRLRTKVRGRLKTLRGQLTREQAQTRAAAELDELTERFEKSADILEEKLNDQLISGDLDFSLAVNAALTGTERELAQAVLTVARLTKATKKADIRVDRTFRAQDETNLALDELQNELRDLRRAWEQAQVRAQRPGPGEGFIDFPGLEGVSFPETLSAAANELIAAQRKLGGKGSFPAEAVQATNNLYRGLNATGDNSSLGIQGLLGMYSDPVAYVKALKTNARAWGRAGDKALGDMIVAKDEVTRAAGRLTSDGWARLDTPLRFGGADHEFSLGRGITRGLAKLPGIRQANRAFGFFGDALRYEWADDMLRNEMSRGRSLKEIIDSGDAARIADIINSMTGFSKNRSFGSVGDLLLFAPRFLQARLTTVTKGVMGLRPGAPIDQRIARQSLTKMVGFGTVLTVSVNEMLGNETDFRPMVDGHLNPNFMRIRYGGRDWSVFGTWDSIARAIISTGQGKPQDALRGMSSGVVSNAWDFITGEDFRGERVRDDPQSIAKRLVQNVIPFSFGELPAVAGQLSEGEIATGTLTLAGEIHGTKSSPLGFSDTRDIVSMEMFGVPFNEEGSLVAGRFRFPDLPGVDVPGLDKISTKGRILTDKEQRKVNEDERVVEFIEAFPERLGSAREQLQQAFSSLESVTTDLEADLRSAIDRDLDPMQLRQRVSSFKSARFTAGQTAFSPNEVQAELKKDKKAKEDQLRELYWLAPAPDDDFGGRDFAIRESTREGVLREAKAAGIAEDRITERRPRIADEEVQKLVSTIDHINDDVLTDYYAVEEQSIGDDPELRQLWREFKAMPGNERTAFLEQNIAVRDVRDDIRDRREALRQNDQLVDAVRVVYWGAQPRQIDNKDAFAIDGKQAVVDWLADTLAQRMN